MGHLPPSPLALYFFLLISCPFFFIQLESANEASSVAACQPGLPPASLAGRVPGHWPFLKGMAHKCGSGRSYCRLNSLQDVGRIGKEILLARPQIVYMCRKQPHFHCGLFEDLRDRSLPNRQIKYI